MTERVRVVHPEGGRVMTKQSDALETDVSTIVLRYSRNGEPLPTGRAQYGDFQDSLSYHEALNRLEELKRSFAALPVHVRDWCQNDPGKFLDAIYGAKPEDLAVMEKLGLVELHKPLDSPAAVVAPEEGPE